MKYFIDTEFIEDGKTIDLISIGIVAEDGREFYAEIENVDYSKASGWVRDNVLAQLWHLKANKSEYNKWIRDGGRGGLLSREDTAKEIRLFVGEDAKPEFWGYYADYDWVAFCQLFGEMIDLPKGFPMYCRDIKQLCDFLGNPKLPELGKGEHNALADARWNKIAYEFLQTGILKIASERARQINQEGWTPGHDDEHRYGALALAAVCYTKQAVAIELKTKSKDIAKEIVGDWPWEESWWKPSPDAIRNLEKAGALIAAEIDRIQRARSKCSHKFVDSERCLKCGWKP